MSLKFDKEQSDRMLFLQAEIEKTLAPYRENTEAGIAVFALVRCAKKLLELYPDATRADLTEVIIYFLLGAKEAPRPMVVEMAEALRRH